MSGRQCRPCSDAVFWVYAVCSGPSVPILKSQHGSCNTFLTDYNNSCKSPGREFTLANGHFTESWSPRALYFYCDFPYTLRGPQVKLCTVGGVWDPPEQPTCMSGEYTCMVFACKAPDKKY